MTAPQNRDRVRVAVVFGGRSSEHAISCVSAGSILRNLDPERFEVVPIGITPGGAWVLSDATPASLAITDGRLPGVDDDWLRGVFHDNAARLFGLGATAS